MCKKSWWAKFFVGQNFRQSKLFVAWNFRYFSKNFSLSPDKLSPDKVYRTEGLESLLLDIREENNIEKFKQKSRTLLFEGTIKFLYHFIITTWVYMVTAYLYSIVSHSENALYMDNITRPHKNFLFHVLWKLKKWCARAIFIFIFHLFYKFKLRYSRQEWFYIFHISWKMYFYYRSKLSNRIETYLN